MHRAWHFAEHTTQVPGGPQRRNLLPQTLQGGFGVPGVLKGDGLRGVLGGDDCLDRFSLVPLPGVPVAGVPVVLRVVDIPPAVNQRRVWKTVNETGMHQSGW